MNRSIHSRPNAFQKRYFAWAAPWYARMPAPLAAEAERFDRWLYSRAGLRFWFVVAGLMVASVCALVALGLPWTVAVPAGIVSWILILLVVMAAWMKPDSYTTPRMLRFLFVGIGLAYAGALGGFLLGYLIRHGGLDIDRMPHVMTDALREVTPWIVLLVATMLALTWGVAAVRRVRVQKELQWLRLAQERDAAARQLAEARLKLLQRQIQPHFIFNTLAAVQHWVDEADPRAPALLRSLTSFLRGSTELLALEQTPLSVELETLAHYLSVMHARVGERLRHETTIDPGAEAQALPAGVLLTLVENAVEHGIAPALHGGTVRTTASVRDGTWTLQVGDDGVGLAGDWREGVGLGNSRARLREAFGDRASLVLARVDGWTVATLRIGPEAA